MKRTGKLTNRLFVTVLALALMALFGASPASATIYQFAVPITTFQAAVGAALGGPGDTYVIYDVYMRAAKLGDLSSSPRLPGPVWNVSGDAPVVSPDAWTDVVNGSVTDNDGVVGPGDTGPYQSIRFTYGANTNIAVIVYNNVADAAVVGKTVNSKTVGELVPDTSRFVLNISSPTAGLAGNSYKIFFFAYADQFSDTTYTTSANKGQIISGTFLVTAQLTPEPVSIFLGGSGILLLAIVGRRRGRNTN